MMHLLSSKMVEPQGPTGKGAGEEEILRKSETQGFVQVQQGGGGWGAEVEESVQGKK